MALSNVVKERLYKKVEEYEGRIPHLYLDTKGFVTVGVGHLVSTRLAMDQVPLYLIENGSIRLASPEEKYIEYDLIKSQEYGSKYSASFYKKYTSLYMKEHDMDLQLKKHVSTFYIELTGYYKVHNGFKNDFSSMPVNVQLALFDMVFNLGITKLTNQYRKFNKWIKLEKWQEAAHESNRVGIQPKRNLYVKNLLMSVS